MRKFLIVAYMAALCAWTTAQTSPSIYAPHRKPQTSTATQPQVPASQTASPPTSQTNAVRPINSQITPSQPVGNPARLPAAPVQTTPPQQPIPAATSSSQPFSQP